MRWAALLASTARLVAANSPVKTAGVLGSPPGLLILVDASQCALALGPPSATGYLTTDEAGHLPVERLRQPQSVLAMASNDATSCRAEGRRASLASRT